MPLIVALKWVRLVCVIGVIHSLTQPQNKCKEGTSEPIQQLPTLTFVAGFGFPSTRNLKQKENGKEIKMLLCGLINFY